MTTSTRALNMTATNVYERAARLEKARAIVPIVQQLAKGLNESPLVLVHRHLSLQYRAEVCAIAGVNESSEDVWALVIESLEKAEAIGDRFDPVEVTPSRPWWIDYGMTGTR